MIAGMINSPIDFPGRPAVAVFMTGCNLRCPYCHNPALISPREGRPWDKEMERELRSRSILATGVVVSGGEPTLDPETLVRVLETARALNKATGLHTNGTRPETIRDLIERGLLDWVGLDLKGGPATYRAFGGNEESFRKVVESISLLVNLEGIDLEVRTTHHPEATPLEEIARALEVTASLGVRTHLLREARTRSATLKPLGARSYRKEVIREIAYRHPHAVTEGD